MAPRVCGGLGAGSQRKGREGQHVAVGGEQRNGRVLAASPRPAEDHRSMPLSLGEVIDLRQVRRGLWAAIRPPTRARLWLRCEARDISSPRHFISPSVHQVLGIRRGVRGGGSTGETGRTGETGWVAGEGEGAHWDSALERDAATHRQMRGPIAGPEASVDGWGVPPRRGRLADRQPPAHGFPVYRRILVVETFLLLRRRPDPSEAWPARNGECQQFATTLPDVRPRPGQPVQFRRRPGLQEAFRWVWPTCISQDGPKYRDVRARRNGVPSGSDARHEDATRSGSSDGGVPRIHCPTGPDSRAGVHPTPGGRRRENRSQRSRRTWSQVASEAHVFIKAPLLGRNGGWRRDVPILKRSEPERNDGPVNRMSAAHETDPGSSSCPWRQVENRSSRRSAIVFRPRQAVERAHPACGSGRHIIAGRRP